MIIHKEELEMTLNYYNLVTKKTREILYRYVPCRYAEIYNIQFSNEKVAVRFYNENRFNKTVFIPVQWFDLEGEELEIAIDRLREEERKRDEEQREKAEEEKERKEYERLKAKFGE